MNDSERENRILRQSFKDKEYRHGYVDEFLNAYIATQIKVLREQHEWSQKELATQAGMMQPRISVMENVNYSSWSIKILRKIAEAFDLTLCVSFESFGRRMEDIERFGRGVLERDSFDDDPYFKEQSIDGASLEKVLEEQYSKRAGIQPGKQPDASPFPDQPKGILYQMSSYRPKKQYGIEKESSNPIENKILEYENETAVR